MRGCGCGASPRLYELRNKERISVAAASKLLANTVYAYKGMGLSMGTMITGWDKTVRGGKRGPGEAVALTGSASARTPPLAPAGARAATGPGPLLCGLGGPAAQGGPVLRRLGLDLRYERACPQHVGRGRAGPSNRPSAAGSSGPRTVPPPAAYGVLDTEFRKDMTVEQAAELGRRAIYHATHRDSYSGGNVHGRWWGACQRAPRTGRHG